MRIFWIIKIIKYFSLNILSKITLSYNLHNEYQGNNINSLNNKKKLKKKSNNINTFKLFKEVEWIVIINNWGIEIICKV